ncbi:MAG: DUF3316 domain-containing protein [Bacteroidales bacterium]
MKLKLLIPLMFLIISPSLKAQEEGSVRSIVSSTMIGMGTSDVLDTYLTPLDYKGIDITLLNERLRLTRNEKRLNQQFLWGSYTSNDNEAENGMVVSGFIGYSWGTLWRFNPIEHLTLAVGPVGSIETGFIYNLRNGNNPASAKLSVEAGASVLALYQLKIKKFPLTLRLQSSLPTMSVFFSPHYEQSYYEIFQLGNTEGIVHFGSFHNQFNLDNYFTVDIPVSSMNLRVGFRNIIRNTHVNEIKNRRVSNTFMIGFSKEFIPFNRKKGHKSSQQIHSPLF